MRAVALVVHIRIHQTHILHRAGLGGRHRAGAGGFAEVGEQAHILARMVAGGVQVDEQVADGVVVALKGGRERLARGGTVAAQGRPAGGAVEIVVGVVGVHLDYAHCRSGVSGAIAVGVKVQVVEQLVAGAGGPVGRGHHVVVVGELAAHAPGGADVPVGEGQVVGIYVGGRAVAVQIITHGVELRQIADFNEAVVIHVVVNRIPALGDEVVAGVLQYRVLGAGAEIPRVIATGFAVQVDVPGRIDAGVAGGGLQSGGGLAGAAAAAGQCAGYGIPVTGGHSRPGS